LDKAKRLINEAERVFFLGFGYAKDNLDVLGIPDVFGEKQQIYGTALGLTDREIEHVGSDIKMPVNAGSGSFTSLTLEGMDRRALLSKYL
jgi:hypothetical protein